MMREVGQVTVRTSARWGSLLSACVMLAACGREREVVPLPEAPGPKTKVALSPLELKDPEAFDRLDRQVLSSGGPGELVKVYDDLARVAPDDPRVLVRGALAALAADADEKGPAVAEGELARLAEKAPGDADAAWLALRVARLRLAPGGKELKAATTSRNRNHPSGTEWDFRPDPIRTCQRMVRRKKGA